MPLYKPLVFVGYPGCGKGTQGNLFHERYGTQHIDSGATLRRLAEDENTLQEVKDIIERGYRFPGKVDRGLRREIHDIILEENNWNGEKKDVILDGWARDAIGLQIARDIFGDINFVHFIISAELSRQRMLTRSEREGDQKENFREGRIQAFERRTLPVIEKMRLRSRSLGLRVEGMSVEAVHTLVVDKLSQIGIFKKC